MIILVINTGSSSIKYNLYDMDRQISLAHGLAERIGEDQGRLVHTPGRGPARETAGRIPDHHQGLETIADLLVDPDQGVIQNRSDVAAVGHRVVHGGEAFHDTTRIDDRVMAAIEEHAALAPLHNPPNLEGIAVARQIFPDAVQVAVFDTAFHQTMPPEAYLYALPHEYYRKHKIRKYGFHGTSHAYVAETAAQFLGRPLAELKLITAHLGNGASMTAVSGGRSIDTSMGLTPLPGLVMGTRTGDVDPAVPMFLADQLGMNLEDIDRLLNKESGLKGLCGDNDMRRVIERQREGDRAAETALAVYAYRFRLYVGAYLAALGGLDALIFTAGVGERAPEIRRRCCDGLQHLGLAIDPDKNQTPGDGVRDVAADDAPVRVLVVPTDEELKIARETRRILEND